MDTFGAVPGVKGQVQTRGVERRRAIVDAAMELFANEGYRGTGLAAIADKVGVSRSVILHHFGSKEKLLIAVLNRRDEMALEAFAATDATVRAGFDSWIAVARWNEAQRSLTALYTVLQTENLLEDHPVHDHFVRRNRAVRGLFRDLLQRGVDSGELHSGVAPARKANEMLAFVEGAVVAWLQDPQSVSLVDLFTSYFEDQYRLLSA